LDIITFFFGLIILAALAFYVGRPLVQTRRTAADVGDTLSLEAQREALYAQIKELDLDHATGKVNDEDYAHLRADLVAQAAAVLRQIEGGALAPTSAPAAATDEVEALIAARRKTQSVPAATPAAPVKSADADLEAAIAARRKTAVTTRDLKCPQCGKPISTDDAFCAKCGAALQTQVAP
jgi:hypothetical protein